MKIINVNFINSETNNEDQTQFDLHCDNFADQLAEAMELAISLKEEMNIKEILSVEIVEIEK